MVHDPAAALSSELAPEDEGAAPACADAAAAAPVTPMMVQYLKIKAEHADCLLFYRMGDFYELFFEDAERAAAALDIALTKRGKHQGCDIAMCGVPAHSHETYLQRLIRKGFRVAVCEQAEAPEDAKKRGPKSVVRRGVVRVVTPGTLVEDNLLDARRNNYLLAAAEARGETGLAWIDLSTGAFHTQPAGEAHIAAALSRLDPAEILVSETFAAKPERFDWLADWRDRLRVEPASRFDSVNALRRLLDHFGVGSLDGFGTFSAAETAAAGAVLDYVSLTMMGAAPRLDPPRPFGEGAVMEIDGATRRNLELTQTMSGARAGSLLSVIDKTLTGAGGRLLAARLAAPLTDPAAISARLDAVQFFVEQESLRAAAREILRKTPDLERALSRLGLGRGGPRDLAAVRDAAAQARALRTAVESAAAGRPAALDEDIQNLGLHDTLIERLSRALSDDLPVQARDGGFIRAGYLDALDEARELRDESRRLIAALEAGYKSETGAASLKIKHNNVLGYFLELSARQADKIPIAADSKFIHRQTMANAVRFTTTELGGLESKIARAAERALGMELRALEDLTQEVLGRAGELSRAAKALAAADAAQGLAELAAERRYVRPQTDNSLAFEIQGGRHPVVEAGTASGEGGFCANSCALGGDGGEGEGAGRLWLITGPNMAGKSTFLRQNALIAVMAQMGSFVPAESARIGVVDRLFSRVGAADDLARGRSTFMVEMTETAAILNLAGERALVILDEIGRGTATYDGLSIAWAVIEHLHDVNRSRALFATHYHELTRLSERLGQLSCHAMRVKEWQGEVIFLHEIAPGAADRSYGLHVGRLAGLPQAVLGRAAAVLKSLESGPQQSAVAQLAEDLPLFAPGSAAGQTAGSSGVEAASDAPPPPARAALERLAAVSADELTPRDALDLIYALKRDLSGGAGGGEGP
ncbi:MAG: DNA mismatch repair protein MutS [Rhodospirillales bacterium]